MRSTSIPRTARSAPCSIPIWAARSRTPSRSSPSKGFYDGLSFHRVVPGFVLQGGCPNGTGTGGPGYEVVGTPPRFYEYKVGDLAMAKTAVAPPGASGSQFFVISGKSGEGLPAEYGILGHAHDDESLATIAAIDALGRGDGPPSEPVRINSMSLREIT